MAGKRNFKIEWSDEAKLDLQEIIEQYDSLDNPLGSDFYEKYLDVEDYIAQNPYAFQRVIDQYRKSLLKKYPYAVWYQIFESIKEVEVASVVHQSRSMETIRKKLGLE
jgi:toxin ParE1/3/4